MLWAVLFGALFLSVALILILLAGRVEKCRVITELARGNAVLSWIMGLLAVIVPIAVLCLFLGYMNAVVVLLHAAVFYGLSLLVFRVISRIRGSRTPGWLPLVSALLVTASVLSVGWHHDFNVGKTEYTVANRKNTGSLKVALFADSHVGTTFSGSGLKRHLEEMKRQHPDLLVVAGDFVDEDTSKKDMEDACRALGSVHFRYGTFYVFGNHDKGLYGTKRGYSGRDLADELRRNGVRVLQDESVRIGRNFCLVGRKDASEVLDFHGSRRSAASLMKGVDRRRFTIVADHQPREYDMEEKAGADLVLSGHTHGGQLIPLVQIDEMLHPGGDDSIYGLKRKNGTSYIVTSGISDWAIKFKTGCRSEYVIVNIRPE